MPISGPSKGIEIKCRRCGKTAKADDFKVDYVYKMAVCPSCIKERISKESKAPVKQVEDSDRIKIEVPKKSTPAGWDEEDEALEKLARQKQKAMGQTAQAQSSPTPSKGSGLFGFAKQSSTSSASPSPRPVAQTQTAQVSKSTESTPSKGPSLFGFAKQSSNSASAPQPQTKPVSQAQSAPQKAPIQHTQSTQSAQPQAEESDRVKHKCKKCGYEFWYHPETKRPKACPYCNTSVDAIIFGRMNQ